MLLGEAKLRVRQIENSVNCDKFALRNGPIKSVVSLLDRCNKLLQEKQDLEKKIRETEETTQLDGNSLTNIQEVLLIVNQKIELLESLTHRTDLEENQKESLFNQLFSYRETRDTLQTSIERCIWETDLLVE